MFDFWVYILSKTERNKSTYFLISLESWDSLSDYYALCDASYAKKKHSFFHLQHSTLECGEFWKYIKGVSSLTHCSFHFQFQRIWIKTCSKVSTTPLLQWGFRQPLLFSWTALRDKLWRHLIAVTRVVSRYVWAMN